MLRKLVEQVTGSEASIRRVLITCMTVGFALLIVLGFSTKSILDRAREHTDLVNHTYQVELALAEFRTLIEQGETTRRGFILTGDPIFIEAHDRVAPQIAPALDRIAELTGDNPEQQERLKTMRPDVVALARMREQTNRLVELGQRADAEALFARDASVVTMRRLRAAALAMVEAERALLVERNAQREAAARTFQRLLAGAALLILLLAIASLMTVLRYTRDLDRSAQALARLNANLEGEVRARTADLTRANEEIQRFAYIVSHDLRSPLVNVMGFTAELEAATKAVAGLIDRAEVECPQIVTRDAEMAAREDLPEAIGFIRTSTAKMDRLINAILKLSREGRRVLAPEQLDMTALVGGIRDSLIHKVDEDGTEIRVDAPLPDLVSDRLAIEQILSNLVENATKYLAPGRPGRIVVRGHRAGARVTFEVEDNGRGIAPADHSRVFDLFRRSGKQDKPGEGIGLAHVRALAYRLGGTVDVTSVLGEGATFRLTLPAIFQDRGEAADDGE